MDKFLAAGRAEQRVARTKNMWWATVAGFCASLVGIGLARFAYTPLLPAIIGAHWFDPSKAAYLGAANLAGYLAGALAGRPIAARMSTPWVLRGMMLLAALAFFACGYPLSFLWFFVWRLLSGIAGGALMVLAAPSVLSIVPAARRGLASGIIFMGVGVGVAASGTLVPLLLAKGLHETWMGLGVLSLVLTAVAWTGWPHDASAAPAATSHKPHSQKAPSLWALYAEYALNAAGWVPHMIFFVDFVARGLGLGLQAGAEFWVLFGIGASIGPILSGFLADRIGFGRALRLALILEAVAVVIPAFATSLTWLIASSMVVGAFVTGTVPLVLGRVHELLVHHPAQHNPAWRTATVFFALFQAVAAYALSFVFSINGGNYRSLFVIGTFAIVLALVIDLVDAGRRRRTPSSGAS